MIQQIREYLKVFGYVLSDHICTFVLYWKWMLQLKLQVCYFQLTGKALFVS